MKNGDVCTVDCVRENLPILGNWKVTSVSGVKEHLIATGTKVLSIRLKMGNIWQEIWSFDRKSFALD